MKIPSLVTSAILVITFVLPTTIVAAQPKPNSPEVAKTSIFKSPTAKKISDSVVKKYKKINANPKLVKAKAKTTSIFKKAKAFVHKATKP